jgi:hypothetical protein
MMTMATMVTPKTPLFCIAILGSPKLLAS